MELADQSPWAMQLVVRDDRPDRPTHLAVCEAAASAVVTLLADPRSVDGPWTPRTQRWLSGRIRKVVRRGRGAKFAATDALDGVQVERRGACVRAFVPGPIDGLPLELAKLQVGGTEMPDVGEPAPDGPGVLTVALTPAQPMTTGKAAAQSGHASQLAFAQLVAAALAGGADAEKALLAWDGTGFAVRVLMPAHEDWHRLVETAPVAVRDAGYTEVAPGTMTAIAWWPSP